MLCSIAGSSNQTLFFLPTHGMKSVISFYFVLSSVFLFLQLGLFISSVIIGKKKVLYKQMDEYLKKKTFVLF